MYIVDSTWPKKKRSVIIQYHYHTSIPQNSTCSNKNPTIHEFQNQNFKHISKYPPRNYQSFQTASCSLPKTIFRSPTGCTTIAATSSHNWHALSRSQTANAQLEPCRSKPGQIVRGLQSERERERDTQGRSLIPMRLASRRRASFAYANRGIREQTCNAFVRLSRAADCPLPGDGFIALGLPRYCPLSAAACLVRAWRPWSFEGSCVSAAGLVRVLSACDDWLWIVFRGAELMMRELRLWSRVFLCSFGYLFNCGRGPKFTNALIVVLCFYTMLCNRSRIYEN